MTPTEQHLKRIQDKVQQMLKQQSALIKENQSLKEELDSVKKEAFQFQESTANLRQQVEILKYSTGEMSRRR